MVVLNKAVEALTFEEIEKFCIEKYPEGIEIDYKKDLTNKKDGLSKHFASFSNTRGGIIVIGVEEDPATYTPRRWEGIDENLVGTYKDKIHSWAKNVEPIPNYKIGVTNAKNNKVFMLVRILEGNETPYYLQNYPDIYIRTGDTSHIIKLASAEAQKLLYSKRIEAKEYQRQNELLTIDVYNAFVRQSQRELSLLVAQENDNYVRKNPDDKKRINFRPRYYNLPLGIVRGDCTIFIQPNYPAKTIIDLRNIHDYIGELRVQANYFHSFPNIYTSEETIPEGVMFSDVNQETGIVDSEQIYAKGLIYNKKQLTVEYEGVYSVFLNNLGEMLYQVLEFGHRLYEKAGYQGTIKGFIELAGAEDKLLYRISPTYSSAGDFSSLMRRGLLDTYTWDIDLNTYQLSSKEEFIKYYHEMLNKIYWDIGYKEGINKESTLAFMKTNKWIE